MTTLLSNYALLMDKLCLALHSGPQHKLGDKNDKVSQSLTVLVKLLPRAFGSISVFRVQGENMLQLLIPGQLV